MNAIFARRSIRRYTTEPVGDEQVSKLLAAAMVAPSARDTRSWHFVVLRDRQLLARVPEFHPHAAMVPTAALAILVCADPGLEPHEGYWVTNCAAATENLLIEAQYLGLGAVWLGVYPRQERMTGLRRLCGVPEAIVPFALVALGHPAESKPPADRYDPARVHLDHWGRSFLS